MMSDLISRQAVKEQACMFFGHEVIFANKIDLIPSADRPTGRWISNHDGSWNCSECGLRVLVYAKGNFCPNCGAKMEGGDSE